MTDSPWGIDRMKEEVQANNQAQLDALMQKAVIYGQCFSTAAGQEVLKDIESVMAFRPTWNPERGPNYGYYYEGQNDVYRYIMRLINYAKRR